MATSKKLELRSVIISLLRQGMGFGVELFGLLSIDELEDGQFRIFDQRNAQAELCEGTEMVYKDVKDAVDKFLAIRDERMLGYDFERGDAPPTAAEKDMLSVIRKQKIDPKKVIEWLTSTCPQGPTKTQ